VDKGVNIMGDVLQLDRSDNYKVRATEAKIQAKMAVEKWQASRGSAMALDGSEINSKQGFPVSLPDFDLPLLPTPRIVTETDLYGSDTTRAKMHRILNGIEPSKLDQLMLRIKDMFSRRKSK
jgi:hypothetical protein